jgi:hypothetical protein
LARGAAGEKGADSLFLCFWKESGKWVGGPWSASRLSLFRSLVASHNISRSLPPAQHRCVTVYTRNVQSPQAPHPRAFIAPLYSRFQQPNKCPGYSRLGLLFSMGVRRDANARGVRGLCMIGHSHSTPRRSSLWLCLAKRRRDQQRLPHPSQQHTCDFDSTFA